MDQTIEWFKIFGTTDFFIIVLCLNNIIQNRLIKKAESLLPFLRIARANFEASDALLRRIAFLLLHLLADTTELAIAPKHVQTDATLLQPKNRRLFNISSTSIREDFCPGFAR